MQIVIWVLQGLLAAVFIFAGYGKLTGSKMHKENFIKWELPQWFRVFTGIIELGSAIMLIVGFWNDMWAVYGAIVLILVSIGGIFTHIRIRDSWRATMPIFSLGVIALLLFFLIIYSVG